MAADTNLLQGEVLDNPENQKLDVERLLAAFLHSLLQEQRDFQGGQPAREEERGLT